MVDDLAQLSESNSFAHYEGTAGYTLYTTESCIFPFVKYEEQLVEINDYCVLVLGSLEERVQKAKRESQETWPEDEGYFQEARDYRVEKFLSWRFLYEEINKCTMLLLLLSFLETTLKEIATWFSDTAGSAAKWAKVHNPKVSDYIHQIGMCCNTDLQGALLQELEYYDKLRKIRNQFVHNEWDRLADQVEQFALADVIGMISMVITRIEQSAVSSGFIGNS